MDVNISIIVGDIAAVAAEAIVNAANATLTTANALVYRTHSGEKNGPLSTEQQWAVFNEKFGKENTEASPNDGQYRYKTGGAVWDNYTSMSGIVVQPVGDVALSTSGHTCLPVTFSLEKIINSESLKEAIMPIFKEFEQKYSVFQGEKCKVSYGHLLYIYTTKSLKSTGQHMEEVLTRSLDNYIGVYEKRPKRNILATGLGKEGAEFAIYGALGVGTALYDLVQMYMVSQLKGELMRNVEAISTNLQLHNYELKMDDFIEDCGKILLKKSGKNASNPFYHKEALYRFVWIRAMEALLGGQYNDSIYNTYKKASLELATVRPLRRAGVYEIEAELCAPIILNEQIKTLVQVADIGKFGTTNNYYYSILPPYIVDDGPQNITYFVNIKSCTSIGSVRVCSKFDRLDKDCNLQTQIGCLITNRKLTDEFYWKRRVKDIVIVATNYKVALKYENSTRIISPAGNKIAKTVELMEKSELHVGKAVIYGKSSAHFVYEVASHALDTHRIYSEVNGTLYEGLDLVEDGLYRLFETQRTKEITKVNNRLN